MTAGTAPDPGTAGPRPDWAQDMTDLHAHAAPSLLPRHGDDRATVAAERAVGFSIVVLKAHEGSTAERAAAAGKVQRRLLGEQPVLDWVELT